MISSYKLIFEFRIKFSKREDFKFRGKRIPDFSALKLNRPGVANLWRMRHTWRIGYLKVAHCTFLMTSYFYSLIFFSFALHRYFSVENRKSEGVKTFFIFCSPPTLSMENRTSEGVGARREAMVPCPPLAL